MIGDVVIQGFAYIYKCTVFCPLWNCFIAIAVALCRLSDIVQMFNPLRYRLWYMIHLQTDYNFSSDDEIWHIEQWSKPTLNSELRHIIPPPHSLLSIKNEIRNKLRRKPHGPNPEPLDCSKHPPWHTFFKDYTRPILSRSILFFLPLES